MKPFMRVMLLCAALAGVIGWSLKISEKVSESHGSLGDSSELPRRPMKGVASPLPTRSIHYESGVRLGVERAANLFPLNTWAMPPPPPPPPRPPPSSAPPRPPPQAPPLPFRYLGTWQTGNATTYYLQEDRQLLGIKLGQVLDESWLFTKVEGSSLEFEYLPLKQTRSLRMGDPRGTNSNLSPATHP